MDSSEAAIDLELRQLRLSKFGRVLACVTMGYVALMIWTSIYVKRPWFNRTALPLVAAAVAFAALWLLLRGAARAPGFVRAVELLTLFVGTAAFSTMALVLDLTGSPDMIVRTGITFMLLVYAVYVPSLTNPLEWLARGK